MEELEHAKARGAKILAEVKGFGMASDAKDMINPDLEGPKEAMRQALEEARLGPSDIDYLNAHGTATALNDVNETRAIKEVFGNAANKLAVSSTKSMHGHLLGASGGVEAVACVKAIEEGFAPADDRPHRARPAVRPRLRAQRRPQDAGRARHVELVRLRRPQRRARVRAGAGVMLVIPASAKRASGKPAEKLRAEIGAGCPLSAALGGHDGICAIPASAERVSGNPAKHCAGHRRSRSNADPSKTIGERSRHSGLTDSIRSIFHARYHFLICFSRVMAKPIVGCSSK